MIPGAFLIRLRLKEDLLPEYLQEFLLSGPGKSLVEQLSQGAVQKNIRGSSLLEADVPVASVPLQEMTLRKIRTIQCSLEQTQVHVRKTRQMLSQLINNFPREATNVQ